jgi:hypothetical protein
MSNRARGCEHNAEKKCRECMLAQKREYMRVRTNANREKINAKARANYAENAEREREWAREWRRNNPEKAREQETAKNMKFAPGQTVAGMLESQGGKCAIPGCGRDIRGKKQAHVDHDHSILPPRPNIRALLCGQCNRGLGCFEDRPEVMEGAAAYIRHYREALNS